MSRTTRRLAMAGSAALMATLIPALPASAATCVATGVSPTSVTLGTKAKDVTFRVTSREQEDAAAAGAAPTSAAGGQATRAVSKARAQGRAEAPARAAAAPGGCLPAWFVGGFDRSEELLFVASNLEPTVRLNPREYLNSNAGRGVLAFGGLEDSDPVVEEPFLFRRASKLGDFNASPEPAPVNSRIKIRGKLTRANWETRKYGIFRNATVWIQFRKAGTPDFVNHKKVKTNRDGLVSTTVVARVDGTWRLRYAGNSITGPSQSPGDYVDVVARG